MRNVTAIMQRELLSFFSTGIAFIVIAGFLLVTGVLVLITESFAPGKPATLRTVFFWTPFVLAIVIPAISMRLIAEEYRTGTIETLMTAPVSDAELVIGKYLASFIVYLVMLAATLIYLVLMSVYGSPDWGASMASYLGLILVGASFLAFGILASSLTHNQVVAWILGALPLILFAWLGYFITQFVELPWLRNALQQINVMWRFEQFTRGLVATDSVVFFVATSALFLFLAVKVVESRRWR